MANLKTLIQKHKTYFESTEKQSFERARRYYVGDAWASADHPGNSILSDTALLASKNLIYAITDTAISSLLGPNPRVAPIPLNPESEKFALGVQGYMDTIFRINRMRRRSATALTDAVLCKRGIFKTSWDEREQTPRVRAVDPSNVFFDLTVRDPDDIGYWLEAVALPWEEFQQLREDGVYSGAKAEALKPDRYPNWMLQEGTRMGVEQVIDAHGFVTIWEYYDLHRGKVIHYAEKDGTVLLDDDLVYQPYSLLTLNQSGIDCLGVSEVQLVLDQQRTVNDLLTHWKRVVYLMIPRILYDSGRITEEDLNKLVASCTGAYVPVKPKNEMSPEGRFDNLFFQAPMPETPVGVKELLIRMEDDVAFVSALAEAARGRVTGARTATEMAIIDAYNRTRLATRTAHLNEALEDVARKCLFLGRKYMKKSLLVQASGGRDWWPITIETLHQVDMDFETMAYDPVRRNPAVVLETLVQLLPSLAQAPNVDMLALVEALVDRLGLPQSILVPREKIEQQMATQAQAQMGPPPGTVPEGGPTSAPTVPDAMAQLQAQMAQVRGPAPTAPETTSGVPGAPIAGTMSMPPFGTGGPATPQG